jgi:hypothetical protein
MDSRAIDLAHRLRWFMGLDEEEFSLARMIEAENARINAESPQLLEEAFAVLTSTERRTWKAWLEYRGHYERQQQ